MLSVNHCKKYLNNTKNGYIDEEIEEIRNSLYQIAEVLVENYLGKKININKHEIQRKTS
jgi:hypothetical protein